MTTADRIDPTNILVISVTETRQYSVSANYETDCITLHSGLHSTRDNWDRVEAFSISMLLSALFLCSTS